MEVRVLVRTGDELEDSKAVVERLVEQNMSTKMNSYLNQFDKEDSIGDIEIIADKNKKGLFDARIHANLDGTVFRFEREDYKNLDDLINHLFDRFKEALSDI